MHLVHSYVNGENVALDTVATVVQERKNDVPLDHLQTVPMQDIRMDGESCRCRSRTAAPTATEALSDEH